MKYLRCPSKTLSDHNNAHESLRNTRKLSYNASVTSRKPTGQPLKLPEMPLKLPRTPCNAPKKLQHALLQKCDSEMHVFAKTSPQFEPLCIAKRLKRRRRRRRPPERWRKKFIFVLFRICIIWLVSGRRFPARSVRWVPEWVAVEIGFLPACWWLSPCHHHQPPG